MIHARVKLDPASLSPVEEKLQGPLEAQLTSALEVAAERVDHGYAGESADQVSAELLDQTKAGLHPDIAAGFSPDPAAMHAMAESIIKDNA